MIAADPRSSAIEPEAPRSRRHARELQQADDQPTQTLTDLIPDAGESGQSGDGGDETPKKRKKRRKWPWILLAIFLIIAAVLAVAAYFGLKFKDQAEQVRDLLEEAKTKITDVMPLVKSGDTAEVQKIADEVLALTTKADKIVQGDLWDFASEVPIVGANVSAVSETTQATHILVRDALPTGLGLLATLDVKNLKLEGGGFNLQPFRDAIPQIPALSATFAEAKSHIDRIDQEAILPFVRENIAQLVTIIDESSPAFAMAEKYLPTILTIMGGDGPRDYILMFQNNAEIRSTGGNPGTSAVLRVDNGKIEMRDDWMVERYTAVGYGNAPVPEIEPVEKGQLFNSDTIHFLQNYTRFPDFRDTGMAAQTLWQTATDTSVNGVFSIDPVLLSYMLKVTGPVTVEGEDTQITADNAVQLLLSDTYERFGSDGISADWYFAKASSAIFDKVSSGGWDVMKMWDELKRGAAEQRVYMWFPDEAQQAMAAEVGLDGAVTSDNTKTTQTGIYLNDESVGKLEYWLSTTMAVQCDVAARTVTTSVALTNSIPDSIQSSYTLGARNGAHGVSQRAMMLDVLSMAIPGGQLVSSDPEVGDLGRDRDGVYNGRQAWSLGVAVGQGETRTVSFTSTVPEGDNAPLTVRYTPTTTPTAVTIAPSCGELFPGTTIPTP